MIRLEGCELRPPRISDLPALVKHANNRSVSENLRDRFPSPYTEAHARQWVDFASREDPPCHFAVVVDGEMVGGIGVNVQPDVFRRSAEIGYWLGEAYWGRGIMTEAVPAVTRYALDTLDICRVFAGVFDPNPGSSRVLEKAGYVLEGRLHRAVCKNGQMRDQLMYAYVVDG
jgi:RimJ/RimL family protein N-acetyltransferase